MIFNIAVFISSVAILAKTYHLSPIGLVGLLLLNVTTTTSLLCVNKEILDLFCVSLFLYSLHSKRRGLLLVALALSFLNRYEISIVMVLFLLAQSTLNPLKLRRLATLLALVFFLSFAIPPLLGHELTRRFAESEYAGFVRILDTLQLNYLYFVAVLPKIAENLFGQLLNPQVWQSPTSWLYINFFNNLSYLVLLLVIMLRGELKLRSDFIYLGAIGSVFVAQSLVIQPRYFYFLYVLLCLQIAVKKQTSILPTRIADNALQVS
jgi:hypothetical protein